MSSNIHSRYPGETANESLMDKASRAASAVQETSEQTYETVKQTIEERPVLVGVLAAAAIGFAIGALWKLRGQPSATDRALDTLRSYTEPHLRSLRNARW